MFNTNYEKKISDSLSGLFDAVCLKSAKTDSRLQQLETKSGVYLDESESLGQKVHKGTEDFRKGKGDQARINLTPYEFKTAIIGAGAQNDPLGNTSRPAIAEGARRRLFLRDLLMPGTTDQAAVEFPTENTFTNNAGSQNGQNTSFSESGATFNLSFTPCETIGHFVHVSKQLLDDSAALDVYIRNTLMYGLRLQEEDQILNGDGASGVLNGLLKAGNFTAYNRSTGSPDTDTDRQTARRALTQIELADYSPNGIVLSPIDWESISLLLNVEPTSYNLFGVPVAVTNSIASGTFLTGDFERSAVLFDREEASISIARHNDSNFTKGMVTLLAESRVSLVVTNPLGLVSGSL